MRFSSAVSLLGFVVAQAAEEEQTCKPHVLAKYEDKSRCVSTWLEPAPGSSIWARWRTPSSDDEHMCDFEVVSAEKISRAMFETMYVHGQRPILVQGAAEHWRAADWNVHELMHQLHDSGLKILDDGGSQWASRTSKPRRIQFADFLSAVLLLEAGAGCSSVAIDVVPFSSWFVLLSGMKRWVLWDPKADRFHDGTVFKNLQTLEYFSKRRAKSSLECWQGPKDLLYVPPNWVRGMINVHNSVSIAAAQMEGDDGVDLHDLFSGIDLNKDALLSLRELEVSLEASFAEVEFAHGRVRGRQAARWLFQIARRDPHSSFDYSTFAHVYPDFNVAMLSTIIDDPRVLIEQDS